MQANVADLIRELMEVQQLSVRKVSARIAEKHGGSVHGYTQQVSRILNDPTYDPTLSTVQKILSALNVSLWQLNRTPAPEPRSEDSPNFQPQFQQLSDRLDRLSTDVAAIRLSLQELHQAVMAIGGDRAAK